jgi:hypothetical protein
VKTQEEAESMGRVNIDGEIWPTKIVELQPPNGTVVWEWHLWDHLIQDVDPSLPNYGVVSDHPELLDINKGAPVNNVNGDWLHANAITHNEDLDQIIFSSRHMNEIYVIDHSTTSEEAAGHSGGNSGKGGDFLYRWGNPMNYDRGTINDRRIVAPHGANWVESSFPGGGNIMIFNNNPYDDGEGGNSEAIEIDPPVDLGGDYYISPDSAFGPSEPVWTHGGDSTYFSGWQGGAYRLNDGNTLISVSQQRFIFEVDINNEIVWQCHVGAHLGWSGNPLRAYKLEPSFFLNGPNIELSTNSINFGGVMDGLTGTQLLHVYNAGDVALELDTVYCTGNFSVIPSNGTVNIGDTLTLEVTFAPDGDSSFTGTMTIVSNDPDEGNLMVTLSGTGTPQAPIMEVSANPLDFGPFAPEQAISRQLTIYNTGMLDLAIEEINISGDPGFSTTFSDATVVPNDSVVVDFQFYTEDNITEAFATASIVAANADNMDISLQAGYFVTVLYVSTTGSDETGNGSEANPFATIQTGIDSSSNGDTVLVAAGTYVENINYNGKNISVIGEDRETTIIDGDNAGTVVTFENGEDSTAVLSGFTITNGNGSGIEGYEGRGGGVFCINSSPTLKDLTVNGNQAETSGAGLWFGYSNSQLVDLIISNNIAAGDLGAGGGISINYNSDLTLTNMLVIGNEAAYGAGIELWSYSKPLLNSVTVVGNTGSYGSGLLLSGGCHSTVINSILWDNSPHEIQIGVSENQPDSVSISYSDISGGQDSILTNDNGEIIWGLGNIYDDPFFCDPDSGDYTLADNSPCIGTGENGANMGVFGVGCGPYNFSPTEFSLTEPSNNTEIMIDASNVDIGSITFSWDESSDANDDALYYFMRATSAEIGNYGFGATATSIGVSYMDIIEDMAENNVTVATLEWTVHVTDGIDTVEADNAPFTVAIDGGYAMSTFSEALIPEVFALHQNYPNPFNPVTTLRYDLPENSYVNVTVYDMIGREMRTLVNTTQDAGYKSVIWNATNNQGNPVSAGVYLYQIHAGDFVQTKKMVLLK